MNALPVTEPVEGRDLKIGDVLSTWWAPNGMGIVAFEPYTGPLLSVIGEGARIATFADMTRMTIGPTCTHRKLPNP